ncbi:nucleoside hydrolase [Breznakiella homolactica]|uniref:Nucleoside hydrolase n=1 Tax=Breznakiella homolactica TaxID=2798577 RepID=A0A7T7XN94_9SPIR|nr:nucleoside hydrolase [Breznakiella homolactica]QQO09367.1 nucleoside hydrolase [Breznakiella homolactica]
MAEKIIIDTDIGDDVDDALAIALALRSPELEVAGITTVYKNVAQREQLALTLLDVYGRRDIPVAVGFGKPIRYETDTSAIPHQCRNLRNKIERNCDSDAVSFIIESVRKDPAIILVAIGPYTNIGMAVKLAPEIMRGVRVVGMGGAFSAVYPEYNIMCDPEAVNILLKSECRIEMVGLDVTVKCVLSPDDLAGIKQCREAEHQFLGGLIDIWMDTSIGKKVTLHDPLTVAYLIDPGILTMKMEPVDVELEGTFTRGLTAVLRTPFRQRKPLPPDNVNVAVDVDFPRLRSLVLRRVFGIQ